MVDSQKVLDMAVKMNTDNKERLGRVHTESAQRASFAAIHALSEVRMGAESAQSHMALKPLLTSMMADGNTQQAVALLCQAAGASAVRMSRVYYCGFPWLFF